MARTAVGFDLPLPDFTDCRFGQREPDSDWLAVSHDGGPARGFDRKMPAFGGALTAEEIGLALEHVRSLCTDSRWPRGELNLPRALVTEKAFPEDEAVLTTGVTASGGGAVTNELLYERRFGPVNQIEIAVPIDRVKGPAGSWNGGIGDIAVGVKRALYHDSGRGSIFSAGGEVIFPTGDETAGLGKGVTVLEPFVAFGQILAADGFVQLQAGLELPTDTDRAGREAFWRAAIGRSFTEGRFGRTWSPMVELLAARELASGESAHWDLVPQVQVTLNTRQHIMANVGLRVPVNRRRGRDTTLIAYLLWDWFDGGLFDGW